MRPNIGRSFSQQFSLRKGLKKFGIKGKVATQAEVQQLYERESFVPILVKNLAISERKKVQESFMFLTEKNDKRIKGRLVYNGKSTRKFINKDDSASPTASNESINITCCIDAHESRYIMSADIRNAFVQTKLPSKNKNGKK